MIFFNHMNLFGHNCVLHSDICCAIMALTRQSVACLGSCFLRILNADYKLTCWNCHAIMSLKTHGCGKYPSMLHGHGTLKWTWHADSW